MGCLPDWGMDHSQTLYDAVIIGGGPAGLTGAIYLSRFRRRVLVLDTNESRAAWVPVSHNHAGYPDGIKGTELLKRMRLQAETYGAALRYGCVEDGERVQNDFRLTTPEGDYRARTLLIATGTRDIKPDLPNLKGAVDEGLIRYCPVCDAFEAIDKKILVLGRGKSGFGEACFLTDYSRDITVLTLGENFDRCDENYRRFVGRGGKIIEKSLQDLRAHENAGCVEVVLEDGQVAIFDTVYAAIGCRPRNVIAKKLGAELGEDGRLVVDAHQETSVPNCFASGDIVHGLNQISVAMGQSAVAATAMHNKLRQIYDEALSARPYPLAAVS